MSNSWAVLLTVLSLIVVCLGSARRGLTNNWAVEISAGTETAEKVSRELGFKSLGQVRTVYMQCPPRDKCMLIRG